MNLLVPTKLKKCVISSDSTASGIPQTQSTLIYFREFLCYSFLCLFVVITYIFFPK